MQQSIWQHIATTPWWFFALFIYLFSLSFKFTKPYSVDIRRITLLPMLPLLLGMVFLMYFLPSTKTNIHLWFNGLMLGIGAGFLHFRLVKPQYSDHQLRFPGNWLAPIFLGCLLSAKLYFGFALMPSLSLLTNPWFAMIVFFVYGLGTGLYIGRYYYIKTLPAISRR